MEAQALHVALDVGCLRHRAAIWTSQGQVLAEFDVEHNAAAPAAHRGEGLPAPFWSRHRDRRRIGAPPAAPYAAPVALVHAAYTVRLQF